MSTVTISSPQVFITLGHNCDLMISRNQQLVVRRESMGVTLESIHLGSATKKRIEQLQTYLEQLKVHCE